MSRHQHQGERQCGGLTRRKRVQCLPNLVDLLVGQVLDLVRQAFVELRKRVARPENAQNLQEVLERAGQGRIEREARAQILRSARRREHAVQVFDRLVLK